MLAAYMAYLKLEEEHGDPARVQVGVGGGEGGRGHPGH
jgi:hypothetical protein